MTEKALHKELRQLLTEQEWPASIQEKIERGILVEDQGGEPEWLALLQDPLTPSLLLVKGPDTFICPKEEWKPRWRLALAWAVMDNPVLPLLCLENPALGDEVWCMVLRAAAVSEGWRTTREQWGQIFAKMARPWLSWARTESYYKDLEPSDRTAAYQAVQKAETFLLFLERKIPPPTTHEDFFPWWFRQTPVEVLVATQNRQVSKTLQYLDTAWKTAARPEKGQAARSFKYLLGAAIENSGGYDDVVGVVRTTIDWVNEYRRALYDVMHAEGEKERL